MNQALPLLDWAPPPLTKSRLRGRKPSRWNIDWMYYSTYFTSTFYHLDPMEHWFNVCKVLLFNFLIHLPRFDVETFPVLIVFNEAYCMYFWSIFKLSDVLSELNIIHTVFKHWNLLTVGMGDWQLVQSSSSPFPSDALT